MRLPKGFRTGHDGSLACPHRDVSCCAVCSKRAEIVEIYSRHFWVSSPAERSVLLDLMKEGTLA